MLHPARSCEQATTRDYQNIVCRINLLPAAFDTGMGKGYHLGTIEARASGICYVDSEPIFRGSVGVFLLGDMAFMADKVVSECVEKANGLLGVCMRRC